MSNGAHTVWAVATDTANNAVSSATVGITVSNGGPVPSGLALVTGFTTGVAHNDLSSWLGMRFRVGAAGLNVTSVGRLCLAGNSGTHTVKLVRVSDGSDVVGGAGW